MKTLAVLRSNGQSLPEIFPGRMKLGGGIGGGSVGGEVGRVVIVNYLCLCVINHRIRRQKRNEVVVRVKWVLHTGSTF